MAQFNAFHVEFKDFLMPEGFEVKGNSLVPRCLLPAAVQVDIMKAATGLQQFL